MKTRTRKLRHAACLVAAMEPACAAQIALNTPHASLSVQVASVQEKRYLTTIRQERDYSCGSAAVATLLSHHYQRPVSEAEVFQAMFARGDQAQIRRDGFSLLDIKRYLEAEGYRSDGFRLPLDKLKEIGVPAIVLLNDEGYRHFVVIKGITATRVLVGDPAKGTRAWSRERFEEQWNGIAFVIRTHRQMGAAHFNDEREWAMAPVSPVDMALRNEGLASFLLALPAPYEF